MSAVPGSTHRTPAGASPQLEHAVGVGHRTGPVPLHWLVAGSITGGIVIASLVVVLAVDFTTRFELWRLEKTHLAALQEIRDMGDKWGTTLAELEAKSDTVQKWRKYFPRSMGGTK